MRLVSMAAATLLPLAVIPGVLSGSFTTPTLEGASQVALERTPQAESREVRKYFTAEDYKRMETLAKAKKKIAKKKVTLSGLVWHDANVNNKWDKGEPVYKKTLVRMYDKRGKHVMTTRTGSNGHYKLSLQGGVYKMVPVVKGMVVSKKTKNSSYVNVTKSSVIHLPLVKTPAPKPPQETPKPEKVRGNDSLDFYGEKSLKTSTGVVVNTCKDLVNVWTPSQLPLSKIEKVECMNSKQDTVLSGGAYGYINLYLCLDEVTRKEYACGSFRIVLRDDLNPRTLAEVYNHEAWHAASFTWSKAKQWAFIDYLKGENWFKGPAFSDGSYDWTDDYMTMPAERWAWTATACYSDFDMDFFYFQGNLPKKCDDVDYWVDLKK